MVFKSIALLFVAICFVCAFYFMLKSIYHFYKAIGGVRKDRQTVVSFLAPVSFFIASNFTYEGNKHRAIFFNSIVVVLVSTMIILGFYFLVENEFI